MSTWPLRVVASIHSRENKYPDRGPRATSRKRLSHRQERLAFQIISPPPIAPYNRVNELTLSIFRSVQWYVVPIVYCSSLLG